MRITVNPPKSEWANLLRRPQIDAPVIGERVAAILERSAPEATGPCSI